MPIDDKLWMYSYNNASASAKLLAEKADIFLIKHEGSKFRGKAGQFILNWGAGTGVYGAHTGDATLLNPPHLIDKAIDKRAFFEAQTDVGGARTPQWTTSQRQAKKWLDDGEVVVARQQVEGAKGAGIVVMKNLLDFVPAPLYTIKVDHVEEYRVYMFKDEVLDVRIKRGKLDPNGMLIGGDPDFIMLDNINDMPADCFTQAKKAARKLPLTTQGLDVIWDGKKAYVLESNTAPYLGIQTAKKYAAALTKMVEHG